MSASREHNGFLTPPEIQHQSLEARRGRYRSEDVDALLERVASSYERVWLERDEARGRLAALESDLERYRQIEDLLRETLADARRSADRVRDDAERAAEATVKRAQARSAAMLEDAQLELRRVQMAIDELRSLEQAVADRLRTALAASGAELDRVLGKNTAEEARGANGDTQEASGPWVRESPAPPVEA